MTTVKIDRQKVDKIVYNTLRSLQENGAHPAEVILALSECVGRTIWAMGDAGVGAIAQRELTDIAIKHMAKAIEEGQKGVIQ